MRFHRLIACILAVIITISAISPAAFATEEPLHGTLTTTPVPVGGGSADAFLHYVEGAFGLPSMKLMASINTGASLTGTNAACYALLREKAEQVASGAVHTTEFSFTPEALGVSNASYTARELGVASIASGSSFTEAAKRAAVLTLGLDLHAVLQCLMEDLPYEMYWFDKVIGSYESYSFSGNYAYISIDTVKVIMYVSADYASAGKVKMTTQTRNDLSTVATAAANAEAIVRRYSDAADNQKINSYISELCALSVSNTEAANSTTMPYGDPWQLIYVFDGDPATTVVCEGFSKAMQYLCNMTDFSANICCYSVTGDLISSSGGSGGHMWNIIHMDDGKNYLVDVTNYKSWGCALCGLEGSVADGYTYKKDSIQSLRFVYYDQTRELFSDEQLTLSSTDYAPSHIHSYVVVVTPPTCVTGGYTTHTCSTCADSYVDTPTAPLGHELVKDMAVPAGCVTEGRTEGSHCTRCDYNTEQETVPALGHAYEKNITASTCTAEGYTTYTCTRCSDTYVGDKTAALGHAMVTDQAATATCTKPGLTEGSHCTRCDYKAEQKTVPALGHAYEKNITASTCTAEGYTTYTCTRCGDTYVGDKTAALTHNYRDGVCTRCGAADPDYKTGCQGDASCPSHSFTDAPAVGNWAHNGIDYCVGQGLMKGMSETVFAPSGTVTRAQLVTILYRLAGSQALPFTGRFTDVAPNRWYSSAIEWAAENQVVNGMGGGRFVPDGSVTREQIAVILYRYAKLIGCDTSKSAPLSAFPDVSAVSSWAKEALAWATAEGLISGVASGGKTFLKPTGSATRAQFAAILMRFADNVIK